MDKLSELLKEAKPLYQKRQRTKAITKLTLLACIPVFLFISVYEVSLEGNNVYMALSYDNYEAQLLSDEFNLLK